MKRVYLFRWQYNIIFSLFCSIPTNLIVVMLVFNLIIEVQRLRLIWKIFHWISLLFYWYTYFYYYNFFIGIVWFSSNHFPVVYGFLLYSSYIPRDSFFQCLVSYSVLTAFPFTPITRLEKCTLHAIRFYTLRLSADLTYLTSVMHCPVFLVYN